MSFYPWPYKTKKATDSMKPPVAKYLRFHTYDICHHHIQLIFSILIALLIIMYDYLAQTDFGCQAFLVRELKILFQNKLRFNLNVDFEGFSYYIK